MNDSEVPAGGELKLAFEPQTLVLPLDQLDGAANISPKILASRKFLQVLALVAAVGLVEPVVVFRTEAGRFRVLDGLLRIEALRRLGKSEVLCLVATDDETYTYNRHVNRLTPAQDAKMIARAIKRGVSKERIAAVLGVDTLTVKRKAELLDGICPEACVMLADKQCPRATFLLLRRMTPLRQIEAVELMGGQHNFSSGFAQAILAATPADQTIPSARAKRQCSEDNVRLLARMERELTNLQSKAAEVEEAYGVDHLHLALASSYVSSWMRNAEIAAWLHHRYPDYASQLERAASEADKARPAKRTMKVPFPNDGQGTMQKKRPRLGRRGLGMT
jgi:hypothetical protein